jgi:hypothetical protein
MLSADAKEQHTILNYHAGTVLKKALDDLLDPVQAVLNNKQNSVERDQVLKILRKLSNSIHNSMILNSLNSRIFVTGAYVPVETPLQLQYHKFDEWFESIKSHFPSVEGFESAFREGYITLTVPNIPLDAASLEVS